MLSPAVILSSTQHPISNVSDTLNTSADSPYVFEYEFAGYSRPGDFEIGFYVGWTAFSDAEKTAIRTAMDQIETFLNIRFVEFTGSFDPDLAIGKVDLSGRAAGEGGFTLSAWSDGTLASFDSQVVYSNRLDLSSGQNNLILHELGHALTLKHPFENRTEGGITNGTLPEKFDNQKYTLMSYTDNPDLAGDSDFFGLFDVFALQDRWGANLRYNTGNNTYTGPRGAGVDVIWDAGGTDMLDGSAWTGELRIDLREGRFSQFGGLDNLTIAYGVTIENARGGSEDDTLIGNAAANALMGGDGDDRLIGGAGDDTIEGGAGTDSAIFESQSTDMVVYSEGDAFVVITSEGRDVLRGVEYFRFKDKPLAEADLIARDGLGRTLTGTSGADRLTGTELDDNISGLASDDSLDGGSGADTLNGGAGDDTIRGGAGTDTAVFAVSSGAITVTGSDERFVIQSREGRDTVLEVERFEFTDRTLSVAQMLDLVPAAGADPIEGSPNADVLTGTTGDDTLLGLRGNDRLIGDAGNDSLDGGLGADTLNGGDGDDVIVGGPASDDLRDIIYAGEGNDSVNAGAGNDLVYGQGGNDTIAGGFGVDELQGQDGDDVITGSAFSDLVFGGAGNDFVNGGFGHDRLNGGTGADKFFHVGVEGHGSDWVQDYSAAEGDVLLFGNTAATRDQFRVNFAHTENAEGERAGNDAAQEAFVIYRPTGQIMWALVDGAGQSSINLQIGSEVFDLLA